jgi:DeoR/GlpR family transcriptional regulator of sugar metabolism
MTEENFMLVSLEDSKSKAIAEVIGSNTCKKIIGYLAEHKEASQKDLSNALSVPMNTLDYNIKKLLESGFVQKRKNFFWSKKGKKIVMYELSNKSIVFSPKKTSGEKLKSILPAIILTGVGTFAVWVFEKIKYSSTEVVNSARNMMNYASDTSDVLLEKAANTAGGVMSSGASGSAPQVMNSVQNTLLSPHPTPLWAWFLGGSLLAIFIISIVNWSKL